MGLAEHPDSKRLAGLMRRCVPLAGPWAGLGFRSTTLRFANREDLVDGLGSKIHGGRWNPPGLFEALYLSLDLDTMVAEVWRRASGSGVSLRDLRPRVVVTIRASLHRVVDLTDGAIRKTLGVSRERMRRISWTDGRSSGVEAITQAVGRLAWERGIEGLIVPSAARASGKNLVLFPGNLVDVGSMTIIGGDDLPERPGSSR